MLSHGKGWQEGKDESAETSREATWVTQLTGGSGLGQMHLEADEA